MCGIAGYFGEKPIARKTVLKTLDRMRNRGPDHQDYIHIGRNGFHVYLLHSRLSIIDLDERANQPFVIGDCALIFNGEIYNYIELREELTKHGHRFRTDSDTEVLLRCYLEYGEECVDFFEGMWSFAIFDGREGKLFLSRDRFSEKPLYYRTGKNGFFFGSEIKLIHFLSETSFGINRRQLTRYLVQGYKSLLKRDETFYSGVYELKYATNLVLKPPLRMRKHRYWTPRCRIDRTMTMAEAIEGSKHHLIESLKIRLRSDVPMAFCLSGGVDSAALVSIAAKEFNHHVTAFSIIDDDERYNEYDNIRATVRDAECQSILIRLSYDNVLTRLRKLIHYHDGPVATITYFIHFLLSEQISNRGFRVVFSGTAADELFTGYYDHFLLHLNETRKCCSFTTHLDNWHRYIEGFVRNPVLKNPNLYRECPDYRAHVFDNSLEHSGFLKDPFDEKFFEETFTDNMLRNRMMNELFHESIPVILHEDDLNSMYYSIENRSPYLDSRLFDFAYSIPDEYLIQNGYGKFILRESLKGILNDTVRLDRRKKGFNASINSLFDFSDRQTRDYLLDRDAAVFDIVEREKVKHLMDIVPAPNHYSKFLFNFINARIFLEQSDH